MRRGDIFSPCRQRGFTYVAMLIALALFGLGLAAIGESWSAVSYREREEALLQVGTAYQRAIASYYTRSPGTVKIYPRKLTELIDDPRFVGVTRHLRTLYADPITNSSDWGTVPAIDGGIAGVYSKSTLAPLRRVANSSLTAVVNGSRYADWKFIAQPAK